MLNKNQRQGILFCIIGPAGAGKSTLCRKLVSEIPGARLSVSATSRAPRPGEKEGQDYFFITREEFEAKIKNKEFFEWEETHGNYYGTTSKIVEEACNGDGDLVLDVEIRGAMNFKKAFPNNAVIVFVAVPSFEELKKRIVNRGGSDEADIQARFETTKREYKIALESLSMAQGLDYLIINTDLDETFDRVKSILMAERSRIKRYDKSYIKKLFTA